MTSFEGEALFGDGVDTGQQTDLQPLLGLTCAGRPELVQTKGFTTTFGQETAIDNANKWPLCEVDTGLVEAEPVEAGSEVSAESEFSEAGIAGEVFKRSPSLSA